MVVTRCSVSPCTEVAVYRGRCRRHTRERSREQDRSVYNTKRWSILRRAILSEQPFCAEPGCGEFATDVDHIVPLAQGGLPYARDNVQPLCAPHHGRKTRAEM
jgi:5-methylcytosine-specific restriction endonuclease McrA